MRVAILTYWWSADNYGQLLQVYALQSYLRAQGHDAYLIRYGRSYADLKRTPLPLKLLKALNPVLVCRVFYNKLKAKKLARLAEQEEAEHNRGFDEFREKYIPLSPALYNSYAELCSHPPDADCYIVGSDQVWNFYEAKLYNVRDRVHAWFLDFGPKEAKRLSYAASWGRESIPDEFAAEIAPLLQRFAYVSVREKSGVELCRRCGRADAKWVCDPTLLLSADAYRRLYAESDFAAPRGKYIFLYMLGNECDFDIESLYRYARARSLEVVLVTGNAAAHKWRQYTKTFATIPEWLGLLDGAEYVVTNSFHCSVFSLIFEKPFAVVPLTGHFATMNTRLDTLFELFGIAPRLLTSAGDFSAMEAAVNWQRPEGLQFDLGKALGD